MFRLIVLLSIVVIQQILSKDSPSLVIELFRHGARSPSKTIDPTWLNHDELTFVGMRQHYILGRIIAKRYHHLVGEYTPESLYIRSTDFNRTLQSAQAQLRGIFDKMGQNLSSNPSITNPPWENQNDIKHIDEDLKDKTTALSDNVAVIPIHSVALDKDYLMYIGPLTCPNSVDWFKKRPTDENATKIFNSMSESTKYLNSNGYNIQSLLDYFLLGDTVAANHFDNRQLPKNIEFNSGVYNDTIFGYQWYTNYVYAGTDTQLQAFEFQISSKIMDYFNLKSTQKTDLKFIMMSGHDTTLLGLLGLFDVVNPDCLATNHQDVKDGKTPSFAHCNYPIYASSMFFEYYDAAGNAEPYIKFIYNSENIDICKNGGDGRCPLSKFNEFIKSRVKITKEQFDDICGVTKHPSTDNKWFRIIEIALISLLALLGAALIVGIILTLSKNQKEDQPKPDYQRLDDSVSIDVSANVNNAGET